jgi:hypothetical protein
MDEESSLLLIEGVQAQIMRILYEALKIKRVKLPPPKNTISVIPKLQFIKISAQNFAKQK